MARLLRTTLYKIWMLIYGSEHEPPQNPVRKPTAKRKKTAKPRMSSTTPQLMRQYIGVSALILLLLTSQSLWFFWPPVGVYANQFVLGILLLIGLRYERMRRLAISVAILPAVNTCVVIFGRHEQSLEVAVIYGTLLVLTLIYRLVFLSENVLVSDRLSKKEYMYAIPLMIVIGEILGVSTAFLFGHGDSQIAAQPLVFALALASLAAITEELFFRGLIQQFALKTLPSVMAVILTTVLYALFYAGSGSWQAIGPMLLTCIVLSVVYARKQNLILTTVLNLTFKLVIVGITLTYLQ